MVSSPQLRGGYPVDSISFNFVVKISHIFRKGYMLQTVDLMNISPESFDFMCHDTE